MISGLNSVKCFVGVNSKCGVQCKRKCESHEFAFAFAGVKRRAYSARDFFIIFFFFNDSTAYFFSKIKLLVSYM